MFQILRLQGENNTSIAEKRVEIVKLGDEITSMKENLSRLREENETLLSKLQQQEKREEENRKENKTLQEERNHSAKHVRGNIFIL